MTTKRRRVLYEEAVTDEDEVYESESDTETELDEKENVLCQQTEQPPMKIEEISEEADNEDEPFVLQLSQYWPSGLGLNSPNIPQDKTLLHLFSSYAYNSKALPTCPPGNEFSEVVQMYEYRYLDKREYLDFDTSPEEKAKFKREHYSGWPHKVVLRHVCCPPTQKCFSDGLECESQHLKIFALDGYISYYLKMEDSTIPSILEEFDSEPLYRQLVVKYLRGSFASAESKTSRLTDTFDFPEAEIPDGFKINLRDYQLRTISWMKSIEEVESNEANKIQNNILYSDKGSLIKFKLGDYPYYLGSGHGNITTSPSTDKIKPLRLYGGILADDTGSGKTITTLGLIHSTPFTNEKQELRNKRFKLNDLVQSRASCIICPSNIHKQWLQEAKKCSPKLKVYGLSNIHDHRKVSFKDLAEADIVVVSYQFLINTNYVAVRTKHYSSPIRVARTLEVKGRVLLDYIHFHRVMFDEFHEIPEAKKHIVMALEALKGDYIWGLTGTPKPTPLNDLKYFNPSDRFVEVCKHNVLASCEFIHKNIKRNVPNLQLPEIQTETVWIDLSAQEWNLLRWKSQNRTSTKEQIMMCSHYQLNESSSVNVKDFVSVEEAQKRMCERKEEDINRLEEQLLKQMAHIQEMLELDPEMNIYRLKANLTCTENALKSAQNSLNYFQRVFKAIGQPDANECRICLEKIKESSLSILPCSHLYCYECIAPYVQKSNDCPLCRCKVSQISEVYRIRIKKEEDLPDTLVELDTSKYSSKLIGLYRYITNLIRTDQNARIILFLQFKDLADFMEKSFKELKVECVRVAGTVFQRQNAISKFRESTDVRIIMMSSENSVSGINLTQATHVILLHPFWTDKGEAVDLAYEKQGISRAYRFGLNHPLKIVRFAVRGTVEEEITLRRQNIKY